MVNTDYLNDITIVIPTYNRNYFLSRSLCYFFNNNFNNLIIADSSDPKKAETNKSLVESISNDDILYNWLPEKEYGSQFFYKVFTAIEKVQTPYATLCSDKDFPILSGICKCIEYLDENTDYHIADGIYYHFRIDYSSNNLQWMKGYTKKETISSESPIIRINKLLKNYSPLTYSVHRTDTLYEVFSTALDYIDDVRFGELYTGVFPLISGKYACLNTPYWCREINPLNSSSLIFPRISEFIKDGTFNEKYRKFREGLHSNLPKETLDNFELVIDSAMEIYLRSYQKSFPELFWSKCKSTAFRFFDCLPDTGKKFLKNYIFQYAQLQRNISIKGNHLPDELRKLDHYLKEVADNNFYMNDLPLHCEDMGE